MERQYAENSGGVQLCATRHGPLTALPPPEEDVPPFDSQDSLQNFLLTELAVDDIPGVGHRSNMLAVTDAAFQTDPAFRVPASPDTDACVLLPYCEARNDGANQSNAANQLSGQVHIMPDHPSPAAKRRRCTSGAPAQAPRVPHACNTPSGSLHVGSSGSSGGSPCHMERACTTAFESAARVSESKASALSQGLLRERLGQALILVGEQQQEIAMLTATVLRLRRLLHAATQLPPL